ncbi:hypothetical protein HGRIS_012567 [Hohenbuehelia grisea]|uniref:OB domain-containing protein n=1 Tax=Hohenbuehelia grisea TaxID=104357 RepID=A0ABR3ISU8_9AGAR
MYRIFLGAPTAEELDNDPSSYSWNTYSSAPSFSATQNLAFSTLQLEEASRRVSRVYENVIFKDNDEDDNDNEETQEDTSAQSLNEDGSTVISWEDSNDFSLQEHPKTSVLDSSSIEHSNSTFLETQEDSQGVYSDASSIGRFPTFTFSLHTLGTLNSIRRLSTTMIRRWNLLLAVLEVEGPDTIRLKKGVDAGKEVSLLKLIMGDDEGNICKLTAWRETADHWSGAGNRVAVKRGDIVHLESQHISSKRVDIF